MLRLERRFSDQPAKLFLEAASGRFGEGAMRLDNPILELADLYVGHCRMIT